MSEQKLKPHRIVMTTKDPEENHSQELIEFYEKFNEIKFELFVEETTMIDLEFYVLNENGEEVLADKFNIPYETEVTNVG